jgi:hypothetical protein
MKFNQESIIISIFKQFIFECPSVLFYFLYMLYLFLIIFKINKNNISACVLDFHFYIYK